VSQRGATKFGITAILLIFYYIECRKLSFLTEQGCRQYFLRPKRCSEPKKGLKHCSRQIIANVTFIKDYLHFIQLTHSDGAEQERSDVNGREESTHEDGNSFTGCLIYSMKLSDL
jgi:hypothetical protein